MDLSHEYCGPATIWTALTRKGENYLIKFWANYINTLDTEGTEAMSATFESRKNSEFVGLAKELGLEVD